MSHINPVIIKLLNIRGIFGEDEIEEFLSEKPRKTYDPFLLLNMEAGVDLILSEAKEGKKICVYGDYDADGVTAVCLLTGVLSHLSDNVSYYVPSRFEEGYGLYKGAIEKIKNDGAQMLITVDCGSVSYEEVEYAKELGLSVLITDHHNITDKIADCLVINPKQAGCEYPFKELAGVGVAFKLAQGIREKAGLPKSILLECLDLVAVGTIGDIVPLVDENRTLAKYGMKELNSLNRKGLRQLALACGLNEGGISSDGVAFSIVPHINAAGRMLSANTAIELLVSENEDVANENARKLVLINKERKIAQEETYKGCVRIVEEHLKEKNFLLICAEEAHEGITGIVAGKIKDKYNKPTVILTPSSDKLKGTGRSTENVNLYELLAGFSGLFAKFGGHEGACGFLMGRDNLIELRDGLEEKMAEFLEKGQDAGEKRGSFDMEIKGSEITAQLGESIELLGPFGSRNKKPAFLVRNVEITNRALMGEDGKHMRFTGLAPDGAFFSCVLFNKAEEYQGLIEAGVPVDIIGYVEKQVRNGVARVQFFVAELFSEEYSDDN